MYSHRNASTYSVGRDNEHAYWIGLHAPLSTNPGEVFWDNCLPPSWTEWDQYRPGYVPSEPCIRMDVKFQPFSTVTMKLWLGDTITTPCGGAERYICSAPLNRNFFY